MAARKDMSSLFSGARDAMAQQAASVAQQAAKAMEKVENLETSVMANVNKTMQKIEGGATGPASGTPLPGGAAAGAKKTRTIESLNREELITVAKRELETAKKLRLQAKATAMLQHTVEELLAEGGITDTASLDAASLATTLRAAWTKERPRSDGGNAAAEQQAAALAESKAARAQLAAELEVLRAQVAASSAEVIQQTEALEAESEARSALAAKLATAEHVVSAARNETAAAEAAAESSRQQARPEGSRSRAPLHRCLRPCMCPSFARPALAPQHACHTTPRPRPRLLG
jgi:hypothetical protein